MFRYLNETIEMPNNCINENGSVNISGAYFLISAYNLSVETVLEIAPTKENGFFVKYKCICKKDGRTVTAGAQSSVYQGDTENSKNLSHTLATEYEAIVNGVLAYGGRWDLINKDIPRITKESEKTAESKVFLVCKDKRIYKLTLPQVTERFKDEAINILIKEKENLEQLNQEHQEKIKALQQEAQPNTAEIATCKNYIKWNQGMIAEIKSYLKGKMSAPEPTKQKNVEELYQFAMRATKVGIEIYQIMRSEVPTIQFTKTPTGGYKINTDSITGDDAKKIVQRFKAELDKAAKKAREQNGDSAKAQ